MLVNPFENYKRSFQISNSSFCSCVTQQQQNGLQFGFAFGAFGGAGQDYG